MEIGFGIGQLTAIRTDVSNPTPRQFGVIQDVSVDFAGSIKELFGQYGFPAGAARGEIKVTGKAKAAKLSASMYNDLFFGGSSSTGQSLIAIGEGPTPIPTTPFTITVTNSATWVADLGVINNATGLPFTRVASGPTAGQYSVAAGVYTFASADNVSSISVKISYKYTQAAGSWPNATGTTLTLTNQLMGTSPIFKLEMSNGFNSLYQSITLNQCISSKLGFALKNNDWVIPEFEFSAFVDSSNNLGTISTAE